MNTRPHLQPYLNNSLAIRQEIQRFESVHPSIYAIYDLIELVPDALVAQQVRDHVVCIEDSFVNSQEWTLSRAVPDLRLGIVGSLASGKSALVHRYLTGSYMQEESPEGGRFKKEILVDGQSYLLLIRDEGGPPELQFTSWVDAVIFVFSVENESSFNAIYNYYTKMAHFRNSAEIPLILVGTQDAISENNPRVIDDSRARKLATDLKRCSYYETCATYGLNVERVFQDACQKIVQQRLSTSTSCITPTNSRPSTPITHFPVTPSVATVNTVRHHPTTTTAVIAPPPTNNGFCSSPGTASPSHTPAVPFKDGIAVNAGRQNSANHIMRHLDSNKLEQSAIVRVMDPTEKWLGTTDNNNIAKFPITNQVPTFDNLPPPQPVKDKDLPTPSSTPTASRKSRRRSNLFTPSKRDDKLRNGGELGSGRAIPVKQGYLYKRSSKTLNKEWKKKYVTLCDDGKLTYHPSLHDYMDDVHGKDISLQYVTVKVPGQKPRGSKTVQPHGSGVLTSLGQTATALSEPSTSKMNEVAEGLGCLTISNIPNKDKRQTEKVLLTGFEQFKESATNRLMPGGQSTDDSANQISHMNGSESKLDTPNVKKRHRRMKSSGVRNNEGDDSDGYEFFIVSLDNKQWHFEASNSEERDEWVSFIEQQILNSLQHIESCKFNSRVKNSAEAGSTQLVRSQVPGNSNCVDCDSPHPDWASLNLGVVICIGCSGIHRNLGSHISKVRSLDLDEWPLSHISVMQLIGNTLANDVWESCTRGRAKPTPNSSREEKERWIKSKYEGKEFLAPNAAGTQLGQQLIDGVCRADMKLIVQALAHATADHVNCTVSARDLRTPLHLACAMGNLAVAQLLIFHNANVQALDHENRTCLAYARAAANVALTQANNQATNELALVELLLASGCPDAPTTTLSRRRGDTTMPLLDQLPSSII